MLSKEETEEMKEFFDECIIKDLINSEDLAINYMKVAKDYIEQLESDKQKLIEKLEKDKRKNNEFEFMPLQIEKAYNNYYKLGKIDEIDKILEILKGEKE